MGNNLPKSPNPHAEQDVEEGRVMVSDAQGWLEELDRVLEEEDGCRE